jgi:cardiolipin synthase
MSLRWIPNAICVLRLLLIWPIVLALLDQRFGAALVLMIIAGFSDALDGFLAKTFDWRTWTGGLLDPIADKLLVTSAFITLSYMDIVPRGLTTIVVARDVVILGGAAAFALVVGELRGEPSVLSKANTFFQLAFLALAIFEAGFGWIETRHLTLLGAAVVFTSVTSGIGYVFSWSMRALAMRRAPG